MYFKKLEIIGFKSFGEKTIVEFDQGVTAIVGPNGCGKSNISDSIRWALGEQSAKSLRGASMEDVIFNGSQFAEPLNLAEVSITLSNQSKILPIEYEEVTITRRLYRSGESEYLLNNNTVRLKDIHELLMGTGIGTESYSIIEQGKMDVILNSKPEERREIFEEAAGITKYKSKKKEALRKLELTDQNLLRVNDIIQEVKRQIGSIERQAKKAQVYQEEFEKLKVLELQVASQEFLIFQGQKDDKDQSLQFLKDKEAESLEILESAANAYHDKKRLLEELEGRLERSQNEEAEASTSMRRDQDRVLLNRERIGELAERKENLNRQLGIAKRRVEEFTREFDKLNAEYEQARKDEENGLGFLASVEKDFQTITAFMASAGSEEEAIKAKLLDNARRRAQSQNELSRLRAEIGTMDFRIRRIEDEKAQVLKEEAALRVDLGGLEQSVLQIQNKINELFDQKTSIEKTIVETRQEIQNHQEALNAHSIQESTIASKIDFLKDLSQKNEGFLGGVKALLEEKDKGSAAGMIGVLANLIEVEKGYELAVEAALEAYAQAVLFRKDGEVLEAAKFLRENHKGRAMLLSLEYAGEASISNPDSNSARSVLDVIKATSEVTALLEKLLSNVFILSSAESAWSLARQNPQIVCVTREGERFEKQFVMGGSLSEEADFTLMGRENRIKQFEEELKLVRALKVETEASLAKKNDQLLLSEEELRFVSSSMLSTQISISDEQSRKKHLEERLKHFTSELEVFDKEIAILGKDRESYIAQQSALSQEENLVLDEEKALNQSILELSRAVKEKALLKEELLIRLTEVRSKQSYYAAQREKIEKDRNWALESKANEESQMILHESEQVEAERKREALEIENADLSRQIEECARTRDEVLKTIESLRQNRQELVTALDALEREKDEKEAFLNEARQKLHSFEMESTKIQFEIDRLKERIYNAYQVDLAIQDLLAQSAGLNPEEIEPLKNQIQAQREKLQKMGPVNLVAIQEFDEMRERYEFLTKQEADLVQAKDDLQKAIQKINRTTRELFADTFAQVQKNFTQYFKQLFNGGHAELVLLDEQDILESGIDIVARPPGKKLQSISLLSGGEKAMTAVALLFSLFKVKPSPFCILDEIDAPLDESNVDRFCSVLKEFISESQFILITHNKRTMNLADAMYGITMQQTGISRIVSVKFHDQENRKKESDKAEVLI